METVIGTLKEVSGHTYDTIYELIFTTERVIAFLIQAPSDIPPRFSIMEIFVLGSWWRKGSKQLEKRRIVNERTRILRETPLDELVQSNKFNFEIPYSEVNSVELSRGLFQSGLKFYISRPSKADYKVNFTLDKKQLPEAQELLDTVLASKIKKNKK